MPTLKGVKVQWSVSGSTCATIGSWSLQGRDHSRTADLEENRNSEGEIEQVAVYNPTEEASFTFYRKESGSGGNMAIAALTAAGTMVTIADANGYNAVTGSNWMVIDHSTQGSNTGVLKETLKLKKYPLITS
jgi:hypothetical protein